ncbi:MAG TPA: LURP-one-related family protein [Jiangellales bacterium]|nr:LURP-one-related family protein [Jiangellales bacterium]
MTVPAPPPGWTRLLVKSKLGAGRDFTVLDPSTEQQRYVVDGKIGPRPRAEVRDAAGAVLYQVRGTLLGVPKHMTISDAGGAEVASLKARMFSPIKSRMTLEVPSGEPWELEGSFIEKNYSVTAAGRPIVQISQKWVTIRDTYTLDVADGTDPGVALAVLWAVDRWVERD